MKLHAKIRPEYLDQILEGKKDTEFRHIDKMVLEDSETSEAYQFEVTDITRMGSLALDRVQKKYPDANFTQLRPCYAIKLEPLSAQKKISARIERGAYDDKINFKAFRSHFEGMKE